MLTKKRIIPVFISFLMAFAMMPLTETSYAADIVEVDGIVYMLDGDTATVDRQSSSSITGVVDDSFKYYEWRKKLFCKNHFCRCFW